MYWFIVVSIVVQALLFLFLTLLISKLSRQLISLDELIIKFISQNQNFYESQKAIFKSTNETIQGIGKEMKESFNLKTNIQKILDRLERYSTDYTQTHRELSAIIKKINFDENKQEMKTILEKMKMITSQFQSTVNTQKKSNKE